MDYQYENQLREKMKSQQVDVTNRIADSWPLKGTFENNHPRYLLTFSFTELTYKDMTPTLRKKIRKEIESVSCRNLNTHKSGGKNYARTIAKIYEEDKVKYRIVVRDKFGKHVTEHTQVIKDCSNFNDLKHML